MKIIDISKAIHEDMVVYKNKESKRIKRTVVAVHEKNDYHESRLEMDMHCGSHTDAPLHMIDRGNTIDEISLDPYFGFCKVFDLTGLEEYITEKNLVNLDIENGDRIIFKTRNSYDTEYNPKFVYLEEDAASYLAEKKILLLGMDAMSIERDKKEHPTHKIILGAGIAVLEDLNLSEVNQGRYFLSALPLKIIGAEASPIRAVLIEGMKLS